jgi:uncharacterized protein (TIGR03083 family)
MGALPRDSARVTGRCQQRFGFGHTVVGESLPTRRGPTLSTMEPLIFNALADEAASFTAGVAALSTVDWSRPTRCAPWTCGDLVSHVRTGFARVAEMLDRPEPGAAEAEALVDAAGYFRPDHRFDPEVDAARVAAARSDALAGPAEAAADLETVCRQALAAASGAPDGRLVRTRHGDAMTLPDYLVTRVVEVAVHGLDLTDAVAAPPWLTDPAATVVLRLLFGPQWTEVVRTTGWDHARLLRAATGRSADDVAPVRPLTLG